MKMKAFEKKNTRFKKWIVNKLKSWIRRGDEGRGTFKKK